MKARRAGTGFSFDFEIRQASQYEQKLTKNRMKTESDFCSFLFVSFVTFCSKRVLREILIQKSFIRLTYILS